MRRHIPNALTLARVALIPALVAAFYLPFPAGNWAAFGIFAAASITDYFDGVLARRWNAYSDFGKFLDPVADKLLVAAALFMLAAFDRLTAPSLIAAIVIVCREILVSGMREVLAGRGAKGLPVTFLAKWKTTVQMVALALLLIGPAAPFRLPAQAAGEIALWIAALLTAATGWTYLSSGMAQLREKPPGGAA